MTRVKAVVLLRIARQRKDLLAVATLSTYLAGQGGGRHV